MGPGALQALVDRQVGKGHIHSIVVGLRSPDGSIDAAAAGAAHPGSSVPMTCESPYLLASVTKMYTASVILKQVEAGRLALEDRLVDLLPSAITDRIHVHKGVDHSSRITVEHLVTQTSGLADYYEGKPDGGTSLRSRLFENGDRAVELPDVLEIVRGLGPAFPPGSGDRAHYADTNYRLLGAVFEAVTGGPIAGGYEELIFEPLGLTHTYPFSEVAHRAEPAPATTYVKDRPLDLPEFLASQVAEGGLVTTVAESLAFLQAFFEGRLFDRSLIAHQRYRRLFFPMQYGYGTMRFDLPRLFSPLKATPKLVGHSGSTGSFAYLDPTRGIYLAGTLNQVTSPGRPFRLMMQALTKS